MGKQTDGFGLAQSNGKKTETLSIAREPGPAGFEMTCMDSSPTLNCFCESGFESTEARLRSTFSPSCSLNRSISKGSTLTTVYRRTKSLSKMRTI